MTYKVPTRMNRGWWRGGGKSWGKQGEARGRKSHSVSEELS